MPRTMIGIVYDVHSLALRRIFIPDDDRQLRAGSHRLGPGEALITSPIWKGASLDTAHAAITNATGRMPPNLNDVHAADNVVRSLGSLLTLKIP